VPRFDLWRGSRKNKNCKTSQKCYISRIWGKLPAKPICPKICMCGDVPDIITCAKFQNAILSGLDSTGVEIFIFLLINHAVGHFLKISYNDVWHLSKLKPNIEFRRRRALSNFVWEHISAPDQDIFRKFGGYLDNGPAGVEWSICISFENSIWRTGGRRPCIIHTICRHLGGISLPSIKIYSRNLVGMYYVDSGLPQGVEWSKYVSFQNPIRRTAVMYHTYNVPAVTFNNLYSSTTQQTDKIQLTNTINTKLRPKV